MAIDVRKAEVISEMMHNLWALFQSGCKAGQKFYCPVRGIEIPALEMFGREGNAIFIHPESLPMDLDVKALSINDGCAANRGRISVELTTIDWARVENRMKLDKTTCQDITVEGTGFCWGKKKLLSTRSQQSFGNDKTASPRTLIQSVVNVVDEDPMEKVMMFGRAKMILGMIYGGECFKEDHRPKFEPPILGQTLDEDMLQALELERRPLMLNLQREFRWKRGSKSILSMSAEDLTKAVIRALGKNPALEEKY